MKRIKFSDFLLIAVFLFLGVFLTVKKVMTPGAIVTVKACDESYEFSASKNGIHKIQGAIGVTTFEIKDGKIRIIDSPCPNKICIHQGWDSPLVCLPNNIVIYLEQKEGKLDAVTN